MQHTKQKLIVLDSSREVLRLVSAVMQNSYETLSTPDPERAIQLCTQSNVAALLAEHGSNDFNCIEILDRVRSQYPLIRRVAMTSYLQLGSLVVGIHDGTIQKVVQKPIVAHELLTALLSIEVHAGSPAFQTLRV